MKKDYLCPPPCHTTKIRNRIHNEPSKLWSSIVICPPIGMRVRLLMVHLIFALEEIRIRVHHNCPKIPHIDIWMRAILSEKIGFQPFRKLSGPGCLLRICGQSVQWGQCPDHKYRIRMLVKFGSQEPVDRSVILQAFPFGRWIRHSHIFQDIARRETVLHYYHVIACCKLRQRCILSRQITTATTHKAPSSGNIDKPSPPCLSHRHCLLIPQHYITAYSPLGISLHRTSIYPTRASEALDASDTHCIHSRHIIQLNRNLFTARLQSMYAPYLLLSITSETTPSHCSNQLL